jgi:hypothetical protein
MIAPDKHVSIDASLIGVGAAVLRELSNPRTITSLWETCRQFPSIGTFNRFVLALDLLYMLGAIELKGGMIMRVKP